MLTCKRFVSYCAVLSALLCLLVAVSVHSLLSATHPESETIIAWKNRYAGSRTFYIQPGHNHHAFNNPNYRRLLRNAILWVSR
ncbi:hypothetical protein GF407_02975 [candidate division KSB1 bacterium]|nr:hypothetical protein [candidate division KSB1 bacterium]